MTYAGARGRTASQMAEVLNFRLAQPELHAAFSRLINGLNTLSQKGDCQLVVANALWGQKDYTFLERFLNIVEASYGAGLYKVDFKGAADDARREINRWVEEKTKEKIKDLIERGVLNEGTRLVLTNAIYFKGKWASEFEKEDTRDEPFSLIRGEKVKVPMMHKKSEFYYMENDTLQALEMPYKGKVPQDVEMPYKEGELSMVVFLPKETGGLRGLEERFTSENVKGWLSRLEKREVIVSFPKFKTTSEFSLSGFLMNMGMTDAFGSADFSGIDGTRELNISAVVHKAFVDVNEEGTEAAAATGVAFGITSAPISQPPRFTADHPFIFIIRDRCSGSILFCGRIMDPRK
jgi:serpin B